MIFLAKLGVGFLGTALVGGAALSSEGFIRVKVDEKQADGHHISLIVPAALVPVTLKFVPRQHLAEAAENLRANMAIIDAALPALEQCPDGVFVEVTEPGEHIFVAKSGGSIVIGKVQSTRSRRRISLCDMFCATCHPELAPQGERGILRQLALMMPWHGPLQWIEASHRPMNQVTKRLQPRPSICARSWKKSCAASTLFPAPILVRPTRFWATMGTAFRSDLS